MSDKKQGDDGYQHDQVLSHAFDGIEEYNNRLPNWWLFTLYASIIFAFGYWLYYETFVVGPGQEAAYEQVMQKAAEAELARASAGGLNDESLLMMAGMPDKVAEGAQIFKTYCVACHLEKGQGSVGPNLTDEFWIHGPKPMNIHETVTNGVLAKGMPQWGLQLGPKRVEAVVSFVLTIKNTQVPGKPPQGERHAAEDTAPEDSEAPAGDAPGGDA